MRLTEEEFLILKLKTETAIPAFWEEINNRVKLTKGGLEIEDEFCDREENQAILDEIKDDIVHEISIVGIYSFSISEHGLFEDEAIEDTKREFRDFKNIVNHKDIDYFDIDEPTQILVDGEPIGRKKQEKKVKKR